MQNKIEPGLSFNSSKVIDYSADAIISKTIAKSKAGSFTLFSFDQGQSLSEHRAPFDAIIQIIEGEAEILIGSTKHTLLMGESIIIPAQEPHALRAESRFKMNLIMFKV